MFNEWFVVGRQNIKQFLYRKKGDVLYMQRRRRFDKMRKVYDSFLWLRRCVFLFFGLLATNITSMNSGVRYLLIFAFFVHSIGAFFRTARYGVKS